MAGVLGPQSVRTGRPLADVFADSDSEHERTFYGFSDDEVSDPWCQTADVEDEDEAQPGQKATSKPSFGVRTFRLRVALRTTATTQQSADEEEAVGDEERTNERRVKKAGKSGQKKKGRVKFEDDEITVTRPPPSEGPGSDSAEDESESFLDKRQKNIKANKAMLAQLMADLEKMPGGAVLLKKQAGKQKTKEKKSRPPRSESRKNPERASRRLTRSMGGVEDTSVVKEEELEYSLEEELLGVRRAPQHRGAPRPNQCKPHVIRPVEDITEDEIQLVADNMTDKVYNRVTGSTCHQCRQKTIDTKTCCRSEDCRGIQGQFCGPCLRNRYGEDVKKALVDPEWKCPPCRGICNCSFCRQRDGRCPTGILFPLAQYHGFSDVHSYLTSLRNKLKNDDTDVEM